MQKQAITKAVLVLLFSQMAKICVQENLFFREFFSKSSKTTCERFKLFKIQKHLSQNLKSIFVVILIAEIAMNMLI